MKTVVLFEKTYKNGNRVVVTNKGVTIWDNKAGRWVVDASTMLDDSTFRVGGVHRLDHEYSSLYPNGKKRGKK